MAREARDDLPVLRGVCLRMTAAIYERDSAGRRFVHPRAWCVIDLDAVRHNARVLAARAGVPIVAMVKADAYGLGAEPVARALGAPFADDRVHAFHDRAATSATAASATTAANPAIPATPQTDASAASLWALGVATVSEAVALRDAGCDARILCCSPLLREELPAALEARVIPSLHRAEDILAWTARGNAPWHLAIDTGMNRAGVRYTDTSSLASRIAQHPPQGVYTHFHSAQMHNGSREVQTQRFAQALASLPLPTDTLLHAANSYAVAASPEAAERGPGSGPANAVGNGTRNAAGNPAENHKPTTPLALGLARPGLSLYGVPANSTLPLKPVLHVYARIVDVRDVSVGETVSYDATWTASRPSRIATVAVGYGDGYRRSLSNVGHMLLGAQRVPVVGNVTMDLTMVDVTDVPCEVGDVVTVLGHAFDTPAAPHEPELLTVSDAAQLARLSPYELLVGWRLRLPRVYRESL